MMTLMVIISLIGVFPPETAGIVYRTFRSLPQSGGDRRIGETKGNARLLSKAAKHPLPADNSLPEAWGSRTARFYVFLYN